MEDGTYETWMAPTATAMCYLIGYYGWLYGNGEIFDIFPQWDGAQERWKFRLTNGTGWPTSVKAHCYAWDQTP